MFEHILFLTQKTQNCSINKLNLVIYHSPIFEFYRTW